MTNRVAGAHVDRSRTALKQDVAGLRHVRWGSDADVVLHRSLSKLLHAELRRVAQYAAGMTRTPALTAVTYRLDALAESPQIDRLVTRRTSQWRRAVTELLHRLDRDWPLLVRGFGVHPDAAIASISAPLGDFHQGGRAVYRVRLNDGRALIYKPRPVDAEAVFGRIVRWFCGRRGGMELASCTVLPRQEYGWTDFIEPHFCTTEGEAIRFYERQGVFLAFFYLLASHDCIAENVVVHGEHPVWVDTECLCAPEVGAAVRTRAVPGSMAGSILATSFVFTGNPDGGPARVRAGLSAACLEDRSRLFDDQDVLRDAYVEAVRAGFGRAYDLVLSSAPLWTVARQPLDLLNALRLRVLPRTTGLYVPLADLLLATSPRDRRVVALQVAGILSEHHGDHTWPLSFIDAELRALSRGDVPYWTVGFSSWTIAEGGEGNVPGVVTRPAEEVVRDRLGRLSRRDRDDQLWLIETFVRVRSSRGVA